MKAPRRPRQTLLLPRLCFCGVGLVAAAWILHFDDVTGSHGPTVKGGISFSKRELIQPKDDNNQSRDSRTAISEFPEDIFTLEQRRQGAVLLHVLCAIYMFHALAIVCDVYFVPSLEKVSENLQLSQDVAGATFMAAGSSAPELFTSLIGVFITKGDVGVGTIVGSAVFNILVIIGLCGIFSGQPISLSWWPLFRDAVFYILSILVLILVIYDEKVLWWETIILISMYGIYIIIMKFNRSLCSLVERHCSIAGQPCLSGLRRTTAVGNIGDCDNDMVPLKPDSCVVAGQDSGVVMVDELMNLHPHQLSFSEASLRLLITPHFPPFTRLRMAGRMVINERQRLIRARVGPEDGGALGEEGVGGSGTWGRENGTVAEGDRPPLGGERERAKETGRETGGGAQPKEEEDEEEEEQEEGEEENTPFKPFIIPDGWCVRVKWLLSWPVSVLLYYTVPDCNLPRWERWYLLTFLSSTLWIALFSYLMVWMVTIISYTLGIPDVIMGITFLAAGTSVPDCMASLIVARQGLGDMAVSNSIGSNIFDVLLGLGFPWALRTLIVSYGSVVTINSKGLVYSVILLLASVTLTVLCVHLNRWKLDRRLGLCLLLLYAIFLLCSIGFERL
ncbi:sodium/potassium/calcium exchanger 3-like isoform X1 [Thunnus albacares]|uniref:sodium/potassium/calcium exchanger 3-like isoform X1 n=1 Tax=Thunnus maccoyii TaxID=8240 RepID=UPI001C4CBE51|nr:sodium/potassium/calcium exchanger 3-like isoform X1 [Thunnus maccoyii]XP_044219258.1 sodium/potassium/calcium exchanger 3-like isoform X1 [Thunnus albacares]